MVRWDAGISRRGGIHIGRSVELQGAERLYRLERRHIHLLRCLLEAYDGVATLRTLSGSKGVVAVWVAPGCLTEVETILGQLGARVADEPGKETEGTP